MSGWTPTTTPFTRPRSGRRAEVRADLAEVVITLGGTELARHQRCWADHQTITDPDHVAAAADLRQGPALGRGSRDRHPCRASRSFRLRPHARPRPDEPQRANRLMAAKTGMNGSHNVTSEIAYRPIGTGKTHLSIGQVPLVLVERLTVELDRPGDAPQVFEGETVGHLPLGEFRWAFDQAVIAANLGWRCPARSAAYRGVAGDQCGRKRRGHSEDAGPRYCDIDPRPVRHLFDDDLDPVGDEPGCGGCCGPRSPGWTIWTAQIAFYLRFHSAPSRTRTDTGRILSPLPLPIGL